MRYLLGLLSLIPLLSGCNNQSTSNIQEETKVEPSTIEIRAFTDTMACIFSQAAYCADPEPELVKNLPGWKVVWNPQTVGGNYAFIASDGQSFALAFRGSLISFTADAFANWFDHDLNITTQQAWPFSETEGARVAAGAYIAWQNAEKMRDKNSGIGLWEFLSGNLKPENPLLVTGHSLGGNMATVYASYCWSKFKAAGQQRTNIQVITFAAPAPGNRKFASDFDRKFPQSIRIENQNDIVPKFPCADRMIELGNLFDSSMSAGSISIGYKQATVPLSSVFTILGTTLELWKLKSGFTGYAATNGKGSVIRIPLSGQNKTMDPAAWFAEAGYQHGMAQYARALGAPILPGCN